jgi:hypothetical protein
LTLAPPGTERASLDSVRIALLAPLLLTACVNAGSDEGRALPLGEFTQSLTAAQRLERATAIRDVSAGLGLTNGPLLAGIAQSETGLAHCWSEATWACQGPSSPSCGGGPVIAGAGDGACSLQQGGLGMFQFDAGTYAQTLARDGEDVLLLEGNIAQGVEFVTTRVIEEIPGVGDLPAALTWMNAVPMVAGDPLMEEWASMIVCRYNGCCSSSATCTERRRKYRDNAIMLYQEFGGAAFWGQVEAPTCAPIPAEGRVVEEREAGCYAAAGAPQFWRQVADGHGGSLEWTMTIDRATPSNHATWALDFAKAGRYRVDVHLDGGVYGQSRQARYVVRHGGQDTEVVIDQTQGTGFVPLGEFDFAAGPDQQVNLGDNTGEAGAMTPAPVRRHPGRAGRRQWPRPRPGRWRRHPG